LNTEVFVATCISLWQPWASLLVAGKKRNETRDWRLHHRGPLLIHAAQKWNRELAALSKQEPFASALRAMGVMWSHTGKSNVPFGAIVGRVNVVDCVPTSHVQLVSANHVASAGGLSIDATEEAFGDFSPGRFAWVCENPVAFETPIKCRGQQKLFEVDDELLKGAA
jgi:activating signal cointegrator 1